MPSLGAVCSLLLFSVLWMDLTMAGSSFLSPEHQKVQVRGSPHRAPHANRGISFRPCHRAASGVAWAVAQLYASAFSTSTKEKSASDHRFTPHLPLEVYGCGGGGEG